MSAFGQYFQSFTVENGLSQGFVPNIIQGSDGFIWMATVDGLNRYDGVEFKVYQHDPRNPNSLCNNRVREAYEDSRHLLWVVTEHGVCCKDPFTERFYTFPLDKTPWGEDEYLLTGLVEGPDGTYWMCSQTALYKITLPAVYSDVSDLIARSVIQTFAFPEKGGDEPIRILPLEDAIWVTDRDHSIWSLSYATGKFQVLSLPSSMVDLRGLWRGPDPQVIYALSPGFLHKFEHGKWTSQSVPELGNGHVQFAVMDGEVTYFFSKTKIIQWDGQKANPLPFEFPEEIISACMDREGNLWLGTNARGVRKVSPKQFHFPAYLTGRSVSSAILEDANGDLWIDNPPGFSKFNPSTGLLGPRLLFTPFMERGGLKQARDGKYWCMFPKNGLCSQPGPGKPVTRYQLPDTLLLENSFILESQKGYLFFINDQFGLVRFFPEKKSFQVFPLQKVFPALSLKVEVGCFIEDRYGQLWIGTNRGLILAKPNSDDSGYDLSLYSALTVGSDQLSDDNVLSLMEEPWSDSVIWVGTQHGLNRLETTTGRITSFTKSSGLPNDVICYILPGEDQSIWFSTFYGLLEMDTRTFEWRHFTVVHGLPANEFNRGSGIRLHDGRLFFGSVNGFTMFQPDKVRRSPFEPRLLLTRLAVNNQTIEPEDDSGILSSNIQSTASIQLKHDQANITFNFALLDFGNSAGNTYFYRLEGVDHDWQSNGNQTKIQYVNLQPGRYVFSVKARNSDGRWSAPVSLVIRILPPWWRTMWAYLGFAAMLLILTWVGLRLWIRHVRLRDRLQLESLETERLKELDHFKSELYTNITHEFRTPITVILGLTEQLEHHLTGKWKEKTAIITRNAEQMMRLINQILDLSRIENQHLQLHVFQQDMVTFLQYLCESYEAIAQQKKIAFKFQTPVEALPMDFDAQRLQEVLDNLISNAIKFTQEGGTVSLTLVMPSESALRLEVRDNGPGIAAEHLDKIFDRYYQVNRQSMGSLGGSGIGLAYSKALVALMEGKLGVSSIPGEGSVFTVELPVRNQLPFLTNTDVASQALALPDLTSKTTHDTERAQILVIEDNADVADYIAFCLSDQYSVRIAANGRAGEELAFEMIPDVVISDISMPERNGLDVCKALKTDWRTSHIPVILLTARVETDHRISGLEHGANVYLTKPFLKKELLLHIQNLLNARKAMQKLYQKNGGQMSVQDVQTAENESASPNQVFLKKIFELIDKQFANPEFSVPDLCRALALSNAQLNRKLSALTGQAPGYFLRQRRLKEGHDLLQKQPHLTIAEVAFKAGFSDPSYFSRSFTSEYGYSPGRVRAQSKFDG